MRVILNVYDLHTANDFVASLGLGFYHSGVEVDGREYSYSQSGGIYDSPPRIVPHFRGSLDMGEFVGGRSSLSAAIDALRGRFAPNRYDMVTNNCNHFSDALTFQLLGKHAPSWINRMAQLGTCVACLVPRRALPAPPDDPRKTPFKGAGHVLGSSDAIRAATLRRLESSPD